MIPFELKMRFPKEAIDVLYQYIQQEFDADNLRALETSLVSLLERSIQQRVSIDKSHENKDDL